MYSQVTFLESTIHNSFPHERDSSLWKTRSHTFLSLCFPPFNGGWSLTEIEQKIFSVCKNLLSAASRRRRPWHRSHPVKTLTINVSSCFRDFHAFYLLQAGLHKKSDDPFTRKGTTLQDTHLRCWKNADNPPSPFKKKHYSNWKWETSRL